MLNRYFHRFLLAATLLCGLTGCFAAFEEGDDRTTKNIEIEYPIDLFPHTDADSVGLGFIHGEGPDGQGFVSLLEGSDFYVPGIYAVVRDGDFIEIMYNRPGIAAAGERHARLMDSLARAGSLGDSASMALLDEANDAITALAGSARYPASACSFSATGTTTISSGGAPVKMPVHFSRVSLTEAGLVFRIDLEATLASRPTANLFGKIFTGTLVAKCPDPLN